MKKSKLLIPFITLAGSAAVVAPVMCLTSCSKGEKQEKHFAFASPESEKKLIATKTTDSKEYTFTTTEELTKKQADLIEFTAICKTSGSNIKLLRCTSSYSADMKTFTVKIDYSIDPAAFESGDKFEYDIKIHNGSWYQTEADFSIVVEKA